MLKISDIHIDTPIDQLLELWVKYSHEMFKDKEKGMENLKERHQINTLLTKKRVDNISILNMNDKSYTLKYLHQGSSKTKIVAILL